MSPLSVTTPLGPDALLLTRFHGREGISSLFSFQLDLLADRDRPVAFEALLGQPLGFTIETAEGRHRSFNGICSRFSQGRTGTRFTSYQAEVVPDLWILSRRRNSRVFQELSIPQILGKILGGFDVEFRLGSTYHPRPYCVQYRETDLDFASRLMEEEGIRHYRSGGVNVLIIDDTPGHEHEVPEPGPVAFSQGAAGRVAVFDWRKSQELRSGRVTLRDHSFEIPHDDLEARAEIQEAVTAGSVRHRLRLPANDQLELYDWPGEYAQRFDGVDPGGGERPTDLAKIFEDSKRTAGIRMQAEAAQSLLIEGTSNCVTFVPGHRFSLAGHPHADGDYVLTEVTHSASADGGRLEYRNDFRCIPLDLPFRPPRRIPVPTIGPQSAVVVGPRGKEIFTDKYGRVKVQFHWDREGKNDENSSCWVRVASLHAGQERGFMPVPRIGQEVVVDFLEGDPDQPIVVGSVYNPLNLPPNEKSDPLAP